MTLVFYSHIPSPLGPLLVTSEDDQLTNVCMFQQKRTVPIQADWVSCDKPFLSLVCQLKEYFVGKRHSFEIPMRLSGSPFQLAVWDELMKIPYGSTITYGDLAKRIGNPKAARAVGLANGQNPIPIIVPCHRVIGTSGKLTGYGGGIRNKELLLNLEQDPIKPEPMALATGDARR